MFRIPFGENVNIRDSHLLTPQRKCHCFDMIRMQQLPFIAGRSGLSV